MASVADALATLDKNIERQTGRPVQAWVSLVQAQGLARHGQMVAWLKEVHGLSHSQANRIGKVALEAAAPRSRDDEVAHLFEGGKQDLRPLYEQLKARIAALGPDVEFAPKKSNVSVRRRKQFALIQPTTRTRLDLGLILEDRPAGERLEASGSFNAMFTHRVRLARANDLDGELDGWLREADAQAE